MLAVLAYFGFCRKEPRKDPLSTVSLIRTLKAKTFSRDVRRNETFDLIII